MKFFIWFSLLLVCHAVKIPQDNIIHELCFKPDSGPVCQKMKTFYWDQKKLKCIQVRYLRKPCGFFHSLNTCETICSKDSWTLVGLEKHVSTLP
ncbi:uncharacterized protein LOC108104047 [Drosophila eugracilis]|uniref:uncharacterized protein LOC108104047 n=1 Tax=Drosophila eugracilis TaxID=29029 RepID=UPI0007E71EFD|nr:uncharacterized protein LOC108104047 [Drosophila eugracilis]